MIIGHDKIRADLAGLAREKKLPQTMLFHGQSGIGKKLVALELVSHILGADVAEAGHPDFFLVGPTAPKTTASLGRGTLARRSFNEGGKDEGPASAKASAGTRGTKSESRAGWTIKIEQIKELKSRLIHYPLAADYQVVVIDEVEKMTATAANSLLKILEEPRPNQIFILITSRLHHVLPTLRSRAVKFPFSALTAQEVRQIIAGLRGEADACSPEDVEFFIRCFQGSIPHILSALEAGLNREQMDRFMGRKNFADISAEIAHLMASDVDLNIFLACFRRHVLEGVVTSPETGEFHLPVLERIRQAEFHLSRHIQKEFVLEVLFL